MKEFEKKSWLDYSKVKLSVLERVSNCGPMGEMESWRQAFPGLEFPDKMSFEEDGEDWEIDIDWEERTVEERIVFVALKSHSEAEVSYTITSVVDERSEYDLLEASFRVNQVIGDKKRIWEMWADGCFNDEELSENAIRDFIEYSIEQGGCKREYVDDADFEDITVSDVRIKVGL